MDAELNKFREDCKKEIDEKTQQEIYDLADKVFAKSQRYLDNINRTTDTGFLAGSGEVIYRPMKAIIRYKAPYSACIEFGTSPHFPPIDPLQEWSERKLGIPNTDSRQVAYRIARKIAREGTDPQPFLRPALAEYVKDGSLKYTVKVG